MATKKKRINVSLPKKLYICLESIALRDEVPTATKAAELIEKAMEIEEDEYFRQLAEERDAKNAKFVSHEEFWKHVDAVQD
jgi:predicted DNA-binding protein